MDDRAAIQDLISRYFTAYESRDSPGCGVVFADDAIVLSPWGPPLTGPDAIAAAHVEWFEEGETNKITKIVDLDVAGDIAACLLHYQADVPSNGTGTEKVFGATLSILRRQPDGDWKMRHTSITELTDRPTGFDE